MYTHVVLKRVAYNVYLKMFSQISQVHNCFCFVFAIVTALAIHDRQVIYIRASEVSRNLLDGHKGLSIQVQSQSHGWIYHGRWHIPFVTLFKGTTPTRNPCFILEIRLMH